MRRKSHQPLPFQCIAYFLCKRRFQNRGSKPRKESLKMGLEDHKGGGVYVYPHGRNYELFELFSQPEAPNLD